MTDTSEDWFRRYYGPHYLESVRALLTPPRSSAEVDAILSCVELRPPGEIADLGCGHGRHACEFARRGFQVVGIDLNPQFIAQARTACGSERACFRVGDVRDPIGGPYDLVVSLFHSFGFFADAENERMLIAWAERLRSGGWLVLDVWNREMIERHFQAERRWSPTPELSVHERRTLEERTGRLAVRYVYEYTNGDRHELEANFRLYRRDELTALLSAAGLEVTAILGSLRGNPWSTDSRTTTAIAQRPTTMPEEVSSPRRR